MTDLRKAAEMALEALEMTKVVFEAEGKDYGLSRVNSAAKELRQALAQPEQEPVAWRNTETGEFCTGGFLLKDLAKWTPLYTAPPNKEWVGLTHDEVNSWNLPDSPTVFEFAQFIEAKLKEKNNA